MRPGPDAWQQPQIHEPQSGTSCDRAQPGEALVALSEEQRRLIDVLQTQQHGMTVRQLEAKLSLAEGRSAGRCSKACWNANWSPGSTPSSPATSTATEASTWTSTEERAG